MLNNRGYTLVELLATMIILGVLLAVTIPNISGISTQNKMTAYAEDAKKFKSTAEYMFRGDSTVKKPEVNKHCVIVNLKYVHGNDFDNPPYGGQYDMNNSFVVMVKKDNRYKYYVQLVEKFSVDGGDNFRGFSLIEYEKLEGSKYLDQVSEGENMNPFVTVYTSSVNYWLTPSSFLNRFRAIDSRNITYITGCETLDDVYYAS